MIRARARAAAWILASSVFAGSAGATAAELRFADPFDSSVFGYVSTVSGVQVEWSALDVDDAADSGSARLVNTRTDGASGPVDWILDCFAVEAGVPYTAGAWILISSDQATTGAAQVLVSWYANGSCTNLSFLSFGPTFEIRNAGSWQRSEEPLTAPAGALGARVGLALFKNESFGSLTAHFDDLLFAPEPAAAASGLAALTALAALRRRRPGPD